MTFGARLTPELLVQILSALFSSLRLSRTFPGSGCVRRSLNGGNEDLFCTINPLPLSLPSSELECAISFTVLMFPLNCSLTPSARSGVSNISN